MLSVSCITSSAINNLTGSIQQAYGYVKNLDSSLNDIRIVTGKSADEMERFAKTANNAAKNLGASTLDYTEAALIYYQQGLSDQEVEARTNITLKTANVTGQTGSEVSEQLTAVWNGYKVSAEEAEKYISLGDFGYFKSDFVEFGNNMIKSKALDDRLGCAVMLELLQEKSKINYTCVFSVQEEIGTRGATASAYTVNPDYAIVIETTTASDIPDTPENKKVCKVGRGAVVSFMDRGTIYNKDLYKKAREIADKNGIANQTKTVVAGGNDASAIHKSAGGIKTIAVSLPCRYIHSSASVGSKADMESVKSLANALLEEFANG